MVTPTISETSPQDMPNREMDSDNQRDCAFPTKLPAEIRNQIYDLIFRHDDPVYVASSKWCNATIKLHRRLHDRNDALIHPDRATKKVFWAWFKQCPTHILEAHQPALSLFLSCRQIFAEASSTFYANNAFVVAHKYAYGINNHDALGEALVTATNWLQQLGSMKHHLRELQLDFSTLCPKSCNGSSTWRPYDAIGFDVGPLLQAIWAEDLRLTITIAQAGSKSKMEALTAHSGLQDQFDVSCEAVNYAIRCIKQGQLSLKRWRSQIRHICLARDGLSGTVIFVTAGRLTDRYQPAYNHLRRFMIVDHRTLRMVRDVLKLSELPRDILCQIIKEAFRYGNVQKISIDNADQIFQAIRPLPLFRQILRGEPYSYDYVANNRFQTELRTSDRVARFPRSARLGKLLQLVGNRGRAVPGLNDDAMWPKFDYWRSSTVNIMFELVSDAVLTLEYVRFDAMAFVQQTIRSRDTKLNIGLTVSTPKGIDYQHSSNTITFSSLRKAVFDAWIRLDPRPQVSATASHEVWVNGLGAVVDVSRSTPRSHSPEVSSDVIKQYRETTLNAPNENSTALHRYLYLGVLCGEQKTIRKCLEDQEMGYVEKYVVDDFL